MDINTNNRQYGGSPTKLSLAKTDFKKFPEVAKELKAANFYDHIKPVIIASRIFGFFPFIVRFGPNGNIEAAKIRLVDVIWFIVFLFINLTSSYFVLTASPNYASTAESTVLHLSDWFFDIYGVIVLLILVSLDMFNRNRLVNVLNDILMFDQKVRRTKSLLFNVSKIKVKPLKID